MSNLEELKRMVADRRAVYGRRGEVDDDVDSAIEGWSMAIAAVLAGRVAAFKSARSGTHWATNDWLADTERYEEYR